MVVEIHLPCHGFRKWYPGLQKKSPGQPPRACHRLVNPAIFTVGGSLQPCTDNESLTYKHKNNGMNNNVSLRITTVDMAHFAAVCTPCARA